MNSNELKKIVEEISQQGKVRFLEGASEAQIVAFEEKNNVKLPTRFREWLRFSDGGEFFLPAGVQMYGVVQKPVINVSDNDRPDESYIVIGALASGDPILCERKGERIAIYNHEADRIESDEIYEDFFAFLNDLYEMLGIRG